MNLALTAEQQLLRDSFARLFGTHPTSAKVREALPLGFDPALWAELVAAGVPAMRVPAANGGLDLPLFETVLLMEEAGRHLASVPLAEAIVGARLLAMTGKPGARWLGRIIAGAVIVVPALAPNADRPGQLINGGSIADALLVLDGDDLLLLERDQKHEAIVAGEANDQKHEAIVAGEANIAGMALARLDGRIWSKRTLLLNGTHARTAFGQAANEAQLLTAALLVGLASQALRNASAYACNRIAFGRPIGRFQGVAHPLADSYTDIEGGRLLVWKAVSAIAGGQADAAALGLMAWAWMAEKAMLAMRRSLRTLGGYGLSLEYDMHLFHRRATGYVLLGKDHEASLATIGRRLFANEATALPDAGACQISFALDEGATRIGQAAADLVQSRRSEAARSRAHHSTASHDADLHRELAQEGWIGTALGRDHSGRASERFAMLGALEAAGYTTHVIATTEMVGNVVELFGSTAAKAEILAAIRAGDAVGALGFSEPGAGSDVFAAQTQAIRDGDDWIINGQKMFTTAGHLADYILLLARSEPGSYGHKGLSLFVVPTDLPGFDHQPIHTYQDERTNITFFADLRLADRYRLGEVGQGAFVMGEALKLEQGAGTILFHGQARMIAAARRWAATDAGAGPPIARESVRRRLAEVVTRFEVAHGFVIRDLWAAENGISDRSFGPMSKLFVTEAHLENSWQVLEMAGAEALLTGTHDLGIVELGHRRAFAETIYGGTSEIHRSLIAEQALGLPKSRV